MSRYFAFMEIFVCIWKMEVVTKFWICAVVDNCIFFFFCKGRWLVTKQ